MKRARCLVTRCPRGCGSASSASPRASSYENLALRRGVVTAPATARPSLAKKLASQGLATSLSGPPALTDSLNRCLVMRCPRGCGSASSASPRASSYENLALRRGVVTAPATARPSLAKKLASQGLATSLSGPPALTDSLNRCLVTRCPRGCGSARSSAYGNLSSGVLVTKVT